MNNNHNIKKKKRKAKIDEDEKQTENSEQNTDDIIVVKRKHTKNTKKTKLKKNNIFDEDIIFQKRVRFGKIDIIDIENWKQINLTLTAEENLNEFDKISDERENKRMKNIGCKCIIF